MIQKKIFSPSFMLIALCIISILVVPNNLGGYSLMVVNTALIYAIVSFGLSIMLGMGGQLSFAGLPFMGVGAYVIGNCCSGRLGFWIQPVLAIPLAVLITGIVAFLLGLVLFKLKGTYFTFATIALVQVSWSFYQNYAPLFGGPGGISSITKLTIGTIRFSTPTNWFYLLVIVMTLTALFTERIRFTALGRSLASIRDDETAALTLGVNVYITKVIALTISGVMAGLAGSMYALSGSFISSDMFNFERSTLFIIITMIGGVNNSFGIVLGSMLITVLPEFLRDFEMVAVCLQLIYGLTVVILMLFMPMGLTGMFSDLFRYARHKWRATRASVNEEAN